MGNWDRGRNENRRVARISTGGETHGPINREGNRAAYIKNQKARMNRLLRGWAIVSVGGYDGPLN